MKKTEEQIKKRIIEECKLRGLEFLGWAGEVYTGTSSVKLVLKDKNGDTWDTTGYNNFFRSKISEAPKRNTSTNNGSENRKLTQEQAKQKLIDSGCPYDLKLFVYNGFHGKSIFICHEIDPITGREHGQFEAVYCNILKNKKGCSYCSGKHQWTVEEWTERATIIHEGRYDYSLVTEIPRRNNNKYNKALVPVICPIHGVFMANVEDHITKRYGCPKCSEPQGEKLIRSYLIEHEKLFSDSEWIKYDNGLHKAQPDFVLLDNKGIIEYDGEQHTQFVPYFHKSIQDFLDQIHRDQEVENYAKENNIPFLRIHYVDKNRIPEILDAWFSSEHLDITTKLEPTIPPDISGD